MFTKRGMNSNLKNEFLLDGELVVGTIGAIDKRKRIDLFLLVAQEVKALYANVKFLVVGDTYGNTAKDLAYKQKIMKMCSELGLKKDVIFTGFRDDVVDILKIFDIFVLTSIRDPLPGVIIEAMASQKPVVSSAVDGTLDLVDDGKTGFLVYSGQPKDYAEKIAFLLKNKECLDKFGIEGRKKAFELFDIRKNADEIMCLYTNILKCQR